MLTDLLKMLVSIDSSTKEGANEAVTYCAGWLSDQGISVDLLENNGYKMLTAEVGSGEHTIVFNGHVDVVPGSPEQFIPHEEDGRLYGRGTADMKAGVAAMMAALVELQQTPLPYRVMLQIVPDEETGGKYGSGYLAEQGYTGDFVICGEPTGLGIGLQAKGVLQLDIEVEGKPAHSSRPWEGINVIERAYSLYEQIKQLPFSKESTSLYPYPSINLAKIRAGDVYNKVPDKCLISLDIRYLPTQTAADIVEEIKSVSDGTILIHTWSEPVIVQDDDPFITLLKPVITEYTNQKARVFGQHGSADTVYFAKQGIPAIEFGPEGADWHGDREYVELESVHLYQKMLVRFVKKAAESSLK